MEKIVEVPIEDEALKEELVSAQRQVGETREALSKAKNDLDETLSNQSMREQELALEQQSHTRTRDEFLRAKKAHEQSMEKYKGLSSELEHKLQNILRELADKTRLLERTRRDWQELSERTAKSLRNEHIDMRVFVMDTLSQFQGRYEGEMRELISRSEGDRREHVAARMRHEQEMKDNQDRIDELLSKQSELEGAMQQRERTEEMEKRKATWFVTVGKNKPKTAVRYTLVTIRRLFKTLQTARNCRK